MPRYSISVTLLYSLCAWLCSIGDSHASSSSLAHTFNRYTLYYESWRYEFKESQLHDDIIYILDPYNNSITLSFTQNQSFIISINHDTIIDYFNNDDWSEIHHVDTYTNPHYHYEDGTGRRRRLWGAIKKLGRWLRRRFGRVAIPPPQSKAFWNPRTVKKGRFIGHFPGYKHQNGWPFKAAEQYCDEHYGGLATIFSAKENLQVYGICHELLKKYVAQRSCSKKCRWIPFRGTRCRTHCYIPHWEKLHAKKYWKGHNCWIGLQLGPSVKKGQFKRWNDMKHVRYSNWDPGEPNYRHVKHCKKIFGTSEKQCETERVYDEKCTEILAYKAGHRRVKRSKLQKKMFKGVPPNIQESILPAGDQLVRVARVMKWNNCPCRISHVPICQKPRGQVYGKYIAVRAKRTYAIAASFCATWYGTHLATIKSDSDNVAAMEACNAIDIHKRSCWIGLQRPFKEWDEGTDTEGYTNWSPGEPNNAGYSEDCAELYGGNGKWNDMGCVAKRYFICDLETKLQRMDTNVRKKMILKRLRRHKDRWTRYRRNEYRKKIRKQYREKMMKYMRKKQKEMRDMAQRKREYFRQRMFKSAYGGFMGKMGTRSTRQLDSSGGGFGGMSIRGRRRIMAQHVIDAIHDNAQRKKEIKSEIKRILRTDRDAMVATYGVDPGIPLYPDEEEGDEAYNEYDEYDDVKCRRFGGLYEICMDVDGVEIKKYIKKEARQDDRHYNSVYEMYDNNTMGYMKYEEGKYRLLMSNNTVARDDEEEEDALYSYMYLEKKSFVYDLDSNHRKQCSKYLNEFQVCLELYDGNGRHEMVIEIMHSTSTRIVVPSKLIQFENDAEWNEIDEMKINSHLYLGRTTKCIHIFDAKICVECLRTHATEINESENEKDVVTSYIANILIQEV